MTRVQEFIDSKIGDILPKMLATTGKKSMLFDTYFGKLRVIGYELALAYVTADVLSMEDSKILRWFKNLYGHNEFDEYYDFNKNEFKDKKYKSLIVKKYVREIYTPDVISTYIEKYDKENSYLLINDNGDIGELFKVIVDKLEKYIGKDIYDETRKYLEMKMEKINNPLRESIKDKIAIVQKKELGNKWSADEHVNKKLGKKPYIINGFKVMPVEKSFELKKADYFTPEQAQILATLGNGIRDLIARFNQTKNQFLGNETSESDK